MKTMIFMTKIGMKTGKMKLKFKQMITSLNTNQQKRTDKTKALNLLVVLLFQTINKEHLMMSLLKDQKTLTPLKLKMLLEKYMLTVW